MSRVSGLRLAELLADRLQAAFPVHFSAEAIDGRVRIAAQSPPSDAESHVASLLDGHEDPNEGLMTACLNALGLAQDFVSETLTEPWPPDRTDAGLRGSYTAPYASVDGDVVRIGFRDRERAVLELPGIRLADLLEPD